MTVPAETLQPVPWDADIASAAALIADSTRAAILRALLPDRPLAAGELARLAGVSAATASFHLAKLLEGGLITVIRQGRHRYYRLAGHEVAAALEALGLISPGLPVRSLRQSREAAALAEARTCYDHLAGRAGVEVLDGLLRQGLLEEKSGRTGRDDTSSPSLRSHRGRSEGTRLVRPESEADPPLTPAVRGDLHRLDAAPQAPERCPGRGDHQPDVRARLDRARVSGSAAPQRARHPGRC
jgi:DNA-binding transcriptional ArsR family regulator